MPDRSLVSPHDQSVTFVELFFDLVFVFSVTQIVGLLHHHLEWSAVGPAVLVFWLVWWAWTQFTWALNAANTEHRTVQAVTLLATGVAFFMAVAVPDVFEGGALWFAGPYVCVRLLGLQLYKRVASEDEAQHAAVRRFFLVSLSGLVAVIAGAVLGGTALFWLWGLAIVFDVIAAAVGGQSTGWNLHPGHFVERHGLIVIIALGESLIVAAAGLTGAARTANLVGIAVLAVAISCAFWWSYFSYVKEKLEEALASRPGDEQAPLARDAFSLAHFPMLCGIVGFAAALEEAIANPDDVLATAARATLALGLFLFIGGTALAMWRALGRFPLARLLVTAIAAGLVVAVAASPVVSLAVMLAGVLVVVGLERHVPGSPFAERD